MQAPPSRGNLSANLEDYLEAIFQILHDKEAVRAKEIARRLRVTSPSVTGALRSLAEKGLVKYAPYDVITLTPEGRRVAKSVIRRHEALRSFFTDVLLVERKEAEEGACGMEHALPKEILDRLVKFLDYVELFCPLGGEEWIKGFESYFRTGETSGNCSKCTARRSTKGQADRGEEGS